MPILALQKRARELGRIRIGQQVKAKDGKFRPSKLDRFRLTSASKPLMEKVAALYGGEVREWTPKGGAQQWEVVTDARRIPIMVPPQPVTQWYETWTGGGCVHRCDGYTNVLTDEPCDPESEEHQEAKPTTRLNVVLRDVEGIGVFRLESHGWNAAQELPQAAEFLAQAGGYISGWLSLEERVSKSDGQTRKFVVPTIDIDVTPAQLLAGKATAVKPIEGGAPKAITAAPEIPNYRGLAVLCSTAEEVRQLWREAEAAGHLDGELKADLTRIGEHIKNGNRPDNMPDEADAVWQEIVTAGGRMKLTLPEIEDLFAAQFDGLVAGDASVEQLREFLASLDSAAADAEARAGEEAKAAS